MVTFLAKHALVDLTRREVVGLVHLRGDEAFVVTEVEVGFRPVFRHKNFTVLDWVHGSWIDVDVRVEFLHGNFVSASF